MCKQSVTLSLRSGNAERGGRPRTVPETLWDTIGASFRPAAAADMHYSKLRYMSQSGLEGDILQLAKAEVVTASRTEPVLEPVRRVW